MSSQVELHSVSARAQSSDAQSSAVPARSASYDIAGNLEDVGAIHQQLPPPDKGAAAWRLLGAAFVFEALLWGNQYSFYLMNVICTQCYQDYGN